MRATAADSRLSGSLPEQKSPTWPRAMNTDTNNHTDIRHNHLFGSGGPAVRVSPKDGGGGVARSRSRSPRHSAGRSGRFITRRAATTCPRRSDAGILLAPLVAAFILARPARGDTMGYSVSS